jgi:uncharacterized protein YciI
MGTFAYGSMAIFTSKEAAEEFVKGDPLVLNGVVRRNVIKEWNDADSCAVPQRSG